MKDFKEVRKKDGTTLVFCDFEELLMDFYNVSTMEQVEPNLTSNGEYIIHCPFCKNEGHTKHKLYIKGDLTVGHCFVCTRSFVNVTDRIDLSFKLSSGLLNYGFWGNNKFEVVPLTDPNWTLDKYFNEFDGYSQEGINYLLSRHKYLKDLWQPLGFKFWEGNIVMPFKYHGNVFYYQIRFSGNSKIRYFFPPISAKPPYIIEHGERPGKNIIICEGVFDAISLLIQAPSYTPVAVLGSSISDYQIGFIREYVPEKILVYMDETDISKRIADKIKSSIGYCEVSIIPSSGEDPEECMKRRMKYGSEVGWIDEKYRILQNPGGFCPWGEGTTR